MGKFVDKMKDGAKKPWAWVKAHPGETCLMVGSAIIGGVTGSKLGRREGFKKGHAEGQYEMELTKWNNFCHTFGLNPDFDHANFESLNGQHATAKMWADALTDLDPERKMSGKLVYDDTVKQDNKPSEGPGTPW